MVCLSHPQLDCTVALLTEGVGRNNQALARCSVDGASPSSRRAWVEMRLTIGALTLVPVALLTEGVGRNTVNGTPITLINESPSSRRAWVEIARSR